MHNYYFAYTHIKQYVSQEGILALVKLYKQVSDTHTNQRTLANLFLRLDTKHEAHELYNIHCLCCQYNKVKCLQGNNISRKTIKCLLCVKIFLVCGQTKKEESRTQE